VKITTIYVQLVFFDQDGAWGTFPPFEISSGESAWDIF